MKKINLLLSPFLIILGTTTTLAVTNQERFTDEANFDDWYKNAAERMHDIGVIEGLPDGRFLGEREVKRSELAVMFYRFDSYMNAQMNSRIRDYSTSIAYKALSAYEYLNDLEQQKDEVYDLKSEIAMAESNLRRLESEPEINNDTYYFSKIEGYTLPKGYTAYRMSLKELPHEGIFPTNIYLNYTGQRFNGDDIPHSADEWYGPFSKTDFGIYK